MPKGFTDLGQGSQVMMRSHQFLATRFFAPLNGADAELFEVQHDFPACCVTEACYPPFGAECSDADIVPPKSAYATNFELSKTSISLRVQAIAFSAGVAGERWSNENQ